MNNLNKKVLAKNLQACMSKKGIDRYQLCEALGFKYSTVSEWISANKYPRMDKIEQLAEYFGVKKSDLIEENTIPNTEEWDKESEIFENEAEHRHKALDKALAPYVPDPKERGMATSIVQQFPRLNLKGLMKLNDRIDELVRFDECISDIEKESRSAGH